MSHAYWKLYHITQFQNGSCQSFLTVCFLSFWLLCYLPNWSWPLSKQQVVPSNLQLALQPWWLPIQLLAPKNRETQVSDRQVQSHPTWQWENTNSTPSIANSFNPPWDSCLKPQLAAFCWSNPGFLLQKIHVFLGRKCSHARMESKNKGWTYLGPSTDLTGHFFSHMHDIQL